MGSAHGFAVAATHPTRVLLLNWRDTVHPEGGGSEHYIEQIARGLHAHGYDVTLRCAQYPGATHDADVDGVSIVRRGGKYTVYLRAMLRLLTHPHEFDVVVDVQNGVPFWSPLVTRVPVVALVHHVHRDVWPVACGPAVARVGWWLESRVAPRVYSHCRYVTVSPSTRRDLVGLGVEAERITLVYNGTDVPPEDPEKLGPTPRPSLVVLGRLVPHKRVELALEALAALRSEFPDVTLTVIGRGYWEPELRALARRLGVADAVTFSGFVDNVTKYRLLAQAWVHVLPSLREGWGLAVMDASRSGTPSVAFRSAGGPSESIIDGDTGLLLDDDEKLADRLADLLRRPDACRQLGARARAYAGEFTWEKSVERFEELVDMAVNGAAETLRRSVPLPVSDDRADDGQLRSA